jgi:signal transduction histidine kinase
MIALGILTRKGFNRDSIAKDIYKIAEKQNDKNLKAAAIWWDAMIHYGDTVTIMKLLQFATEQNLPTYQIAANLAMADYHIHHKLELSNYYATKADSILNSAHKEYLNKDSLRIEILHRFSHFFIHRGQGLNTARYLVQLRNYGEREETDALKIQALEKLIGMYLEWDTAQGRKSIPWNKSLYDHFKKTGQPNKVLSCAYILGMMYSKLSMNDSAARYYGEMDKLSDSLQAYGEFLYWSLQMRMYNHLLSVEQAVDLIDSDFNNHWPLSLPDKVMAKVQAYFFNDRFDSAFLYISKLKKVNPGYYKLLLPEFYIKIKDYKKALPLLKENEKDVQGSDLQDIYKKLSEAYNNQENYQLAYEYLLKYNKITDSLDNLAAEAEIISLEMQKEVELQQASFNEQEQLQKAKQDKIAFGNRIRFFGTLAGAAVFLLIAGLLWRSNRRKQKDKVKIEQAYDNLKATQQQLVQSEKMASLGELTAGIAHEIQNPLNFVNNFSDVNEELLTEMKDELSKGKIDDAIALANDAIENQKKINHHGKRADAIVKNMLQHSRASSGKKGLTDINALAEEYLRLSYHGLRAKDKSFNAITKTDFDNSIEKLNIIPQDIGRVVLNLINNAFYAVDERKKQNQNGYEPIVSVGTKRSNGKVEISVKDNGNGIPQKVLDKIFQPFFTTKPTGQGTGLGLSLSYDIVKAHGGELKVETKEGEGSEFVVLLS